MIPKLPQGYSQPFVIGEGAHSSVFRARQDLLNRFVAIKVLKENSAVRRRELLHEATVHAGISLQSAPRVFDAFQWRHSVFITMEWIRGARLSLILKENLTENTRIHLAGGIIRALGELHGSGFAHRDLKPDNILIHPGKGVYIVDFGFTRDIDKQRKSMSGTVKGTPAFMAPELWAGNGDVDFMRSDVYAAGRILSMVLMNTGFERIADEMVSEDPGKRPGNGVCILAQWEKFGITEPVPELWKTIAGQAVSKHIAVSLINGAESLINARRKAEAYWLLAESLDEDPENARALELMEAVSSSPLNRRSFWKAGWVLTAGTFLLLMLAFLTGFYKGRRTFPVAAVKPANVYRITGINRTLTGYDGSVLQAHHLKSGLKKYNSLTAEITVINLPAEGGLLFNDSLIEKSSAIAGFQVPFGSHQLRWVDENGDVIWMEKVRLLPFQSGIFPMPSALNRMKG